MGRIFSGVQPTGEGPHFGNYTGAFRQWVGLQDDHECLFCVVDLHSMTEPWEPKTLKDQTRKTAACLLACGIDPDRSTLFVQSDVGAHSELAWIFTCISRMGELGRMTQFKERSRGQQPGAVGAGLFMYPVLMAADVLAYRADLVPVGDDQRQHLELMRQLAERFNRLFTQTFPPPETLTPAQGARIMALDDPSQKMSKSQFRPSSNIWMLDSVDDIRSKVGRAVTDSGREITYGPEKPAISNLLDIFSIASDRNPPELEKEYEGAGYAQLKADLTEALIAFLEPFQKRFIQFYEDAPGLDRILDRGADQARALSAETLRTVRERIGVRRP